jgi:beta-lactamase class A
MSKKIIIVQFAFILIVAALLFVYIRFKRPAGNTFVVAPVKADNVMNSVQPKEIGFINPATAINLNKHYIINFKPLRDDLAAYQAQQHKATKQAQKTYIYFAYLNNSSWIGLNEKDMFTAASTIKVPLAMTIYKMEEQGKLHSTDSYTLEDLDIDKNFGNLYKVGPDNSFTIEELTHIMLTYSDNTAMQALFHVLKLSGIDDPLTDLYNAIGWDYSDFGTVPTYIQINVKTLSNMFVALYNASYDNIDNSKKILEYLSESVFDEQIVAGVPKNVIVSHKIGVNGEDFTYSDCGIVYAPNRPYILCVGSSGVPKVVADEFIKTVSKMVYQYVIKN